MTALTSLGETRRERRGVIAFFRRSRIAGILAAFLGLALSGALVAGVSFSAFTSTTASKGNSFATATVGLTSNVANSGPIFSGTNLFPGATGTKLVTINAVTSFAGPVRFYIANRNSTKDPSSVLSDAVTVTVTQGSVDTSGNFTADKSGSNGDGVVFNGKLTNLFLAQSYSAGLGDWTVKGTGTAAAPETKTYKISYTLSSSAGDSVQSLSTVFDVMWEVQPSAS